MKVKDYWLVEIWVWVFFILVGIVWSARAGDTYDCINSKSDYYAPRPSPNTEIVIAPDSRAQEARWRAMLDERDLRHLEFIRARRARYFYLNGF
jgi:hypothetical protein